MSNKIGKRGESIFSTIISRNIPDSTNIIIRWNEVASFWNNHQKLPTFLSTLQHQPMHKKDFNKWRAEKLGYVYFSRLSDLIINEPNLPQFDYLIDIGENEKETGRLFGVEVLPYNKDLNGTFSKEYQNIAFPALLVMFDNQNDNGYYKWLKKPVENGQLVLETSKNNIAELNNNSLNEIVAEVKDWYSRQHTA